MAFLTTVFYKNYLHSDSDIQRHNSTFYLLLCGFFPFHSACYCAFLPPQCARSCEWRNCDVYMKSRFVFEPGVVPNSAPCQIMHPLVLVGLGVGVGEGLGLGVGLGLGNQVAISTRGCIIWQGCRFRHNTGVTCQWGNEASFPQVTWQPLFKQCSGTLFRSTRLVCRKLETCVDTRCRSTHP